MHDYVKKLRQNVGLETWKWRQIVMSQTANTKYKWPPFDPEPTPPPWKFSAYATVWQNFTFTIWLSQSNLTELHSDKPIFPDRCWCLGSRNGLTVTPWVTAERVFKKTDFLSKCGCIYTWSLFQCLSTPLYFRWSNCLLLVKSSGDWSISLASGTSVALFMSEFPSSELQFVFLLRISCHVHFLVVFDHLSCDFCWRLSAFSLRWLEVSVRK